MAPSRSRSRRILIVVAVVLLAAVVLPAAAGACPLCRDAKSDSDYAGGTASLPSGFYYSILFMMCAPFLVLGALATRIVLARRKLRLAGEVRASGARDAETAAGSALAVDSAGSTL